MKLPIFIISPGFFIEILIILVMARFFIEGIKRYKNIAKALKEDVQILNDIDNDSIDIKDIDILVDFVESEYLENAESIVLRRLKNIKCLMAFPEKKIDQDALAEITFVRECSKLDFLKSYANTAIMLGLLATIFGLGISFFSMGAPSLKSLNNIIHNIIFTFLATIIGLILAIILNFIYLHIKEILTSFLTNLEEFSTVKLIPLYTSNPETTEAAKLARMESFINALTTTANNFHKATTNFSNWTVNIKEFSKNFQDGVNIIKEKEEHLIIQYEDLTNLNKSISSKFKKHFENLEKFLDNTIKLIEASETHLISTHNKLDSFGEHITNVINTISIFAKDEKDSLLKELQKIDDNNRLENETLLKELQHINNENKLEKDAIVKELQHMNLEHRLELEKSSISLKEAFIDNTKEIIEEYKKAHSEVLEDYKNRRDLIDVHYKEELSQTGHIMMDEINNSINILIHGNNRLHKERADDMGRLIFDFRESVKGILDCWKEEVFKDIIETIKKLEFQNLIHALENIEISQREQIEVMRKFSKDDLVNEQLSNIQKNVKDIDYHVHQEIITFKELENSINRLKEIMEKTSYLYEQSYKSSKFIN